MPRTLIFDEASPASSKKHLTIFVENKPTYGAISPDAVVLDIYQGDVSYSDGSVGRLNLTQIAFDGYDFHEFLKSLAQFDPTKKEKT